MTKPRKKPKGMDKKLKAKWIKALLSGRYKQTLHVLESVEENGKKGHCCLGVLCRVARLPNNAKKGQETRFKFGYSDDGDPVTESCKLPEIFLKKIGIPGEIQSELIQMNDDWRSGFKDIAKYIRKNL